MCTSFPVGHLSKSRSCVQSFDSSQANKLNFMLQTWDMLVFVARLRKKEIILWRPLAKSVEKTKLQN